jgi:hypothetical protein
MLPLIPSPSKSSLHPFDEEAAFQLGNRSDDREDCLPEWRSRVDLLTEGDKLDGEVPEQLKGIHKMAY